MERIFAILMYLCAIDAAAAYKSRYREIGLNEFTLTQLRTMLSCSDKEFQPHIMQRGEYWVLKNYIRADHGLILCHETVTYTTHADFKFLDNVVPLVERWLAPISLAVHAPGTDFTPTINSIRYLRDCTKNNLIRHFVTFHLFFSNKHIPDVIPKEENLIATPYKCNGPPPYPKRFTMYKTLKNLVYPVNVARNIARDAALTHFILASDIELYPSPFLVPQFLNMIARNKGPLKTSTKSKVFPISIFEVDEIYQVPSTKKELQEMLANKSAIPFHRFVCPKCHNIPLLQQWMRADVTKNMEVFHVSKHHGTYKHWEPIFIGTHQDPYYEERLSWEGKADKMTQAYVLCVKDYEFMILNNAFLTHKPGIKHFKKDTKRDMIANKQWSYINNIIMPELKKLYGSRNECEL